MLSCGLSPVSLYRVNQRFSVLLNYAVKYYKLPSNPCRIAGSIGSARSASVSFWTYDEFKKFIAAVDKKPAHIGFSLLYWTGMRVGELFALTASDFDFESGTVSISKSFQRLNKTDIISTPKTEKSNRVIQVPEAVMKEVQENISLLYDYQSGDRLFPYSLLYLHKNMTLYSAIAGVKRIRIHDLRHSHASLLIEKDIPILLISKRLGHSNIRITLDVYGHLYPTREGEMIGKLNNLIAQDGV